MKRSTTLLAVLAVAGTAQAAQLTLFKQPNFSGEALTLHNDTSDLSGTHFQDQVSSVVVQSGRWQVCTQPNFQGNCSVLEPGRYATLEQDLNHRIESVRQLSGYALNDCRERNGDCGRTYGHAYRDDRFRGYDERDRYGYGERDRTYGTYDRDRGYPERSDYGSTDRWNGDRWNNGGR